MPIRILLLPVCLARTSTLLTEQEVSRSWRQLFKKGAELTAENFEKAELLLDELRPESPLRHRLSQELGDLRSMSGV